MQTFQAIDLRQPRDFSRKMNATFEFIRQNFRPLAKAILYIAGPPAIVASLLIGSFMSDVMSFGQFAGNAEASPVNTPGFWIQYFLMIVLYMISGVFTISTINNYIFLYGEKKTNRIEVAEVWERVKATFGMYLGTMLLFMVLTFAVAFAFVFPVALLSAISPFFIFLALFVGFGGVVYLFVSVSLVFIVRTYEDVGFFGAISRSFSLIRGKWWSTFGLLMILYMIVTFVSYFMIIGWSLASVAVAFHDADKASTDEAMGSFKVVTIVFFSLYYLVQMILYCLPNIGLAFQYFNLVERKEAKSLINEIQNIGSVQKPADNPDDQY